MITKNIKVNSIIESYFINAALAIAFMPITVNYFPGLSANTLNKRVVVQAIIIAFALMQATCTPNNRTENTNRIIKAGALLTFILNTIDTIQPNRTVRLWMPASILISMLAGVMVNLSKSKNLITRKRYRSPEAGTLFVAWLVNFAIGTLMLPAFDNTFFEGKVTKTITALPAMARASIIIFGPLTLALIKSAATAFFTEKSDDDINDRRLSRFAPITLAALIMNVIAFTTLYPVILNSMAIFTVMLGWTTLLRGAGTKASEPNSISARPLLLATSAAASNSDEVEEFPVVIA